MMLALALMTAGAVGSTARGLLGFRLNRRLPTGTFIANLVACLFLGLVSEWDGATGTAVRVGLLGSLSTWSSFAFEVSMMWRVGRRADAFAYLTITVVLGVGSAWLGLRLAQ